MKTEQDLKLFAKVVLNKAAKLGDRDVYFDKASEKFVDFPEGSTSSQQCARKNLRGFVGRYNSKAAVDWVVEDCKAMLA